MITPAYALKMARYNRWMNDKLYGHCATLADADRKADMGAFFGSIHGTLNHLLLADRVWMGRFTGPVFTPASRVGVTTATSATGSAPASITTIGSGSAGGGG